MTLGILFLVGICAGWIDSIAGGGGLIVMPSLLWAGLSPIQALATNKAQSSFGSGSAMLNYARHGLINFKELKFSIFMTFCGSLFGAYIISKLQNDLLLRVIPYLLITFSLYFLFSPNISDIDRKKRISLFAFAITAGFTIGFYDGFFGPGTGSFFTLAFTMLLGFGITRATANTKVLNFTSNIAALIFFAFQGAIVIKVAIAMAAGQMIGSVIGSNMAVRKGKALIKPILVIVPIVMAIKILTAN